MNAIMMCKHPSGLEGAQWGLSSLSPAWISVLVNDDDDSHLYGFVISESLGLSQSSLLLYFIAPSTVCSICFGPLGNLKFDRDLWIVYKAIQFRNLCETGATNHDACRPLAGDVNKERGRNDKQQRMVGCGKLECMHHGKVGPAASHLMPTN